MANSVTHFEIFASDVERAREFYENVFGWTFETGGPPDFYHIATGPDTDPGLRGDSVSGGGTKPATLETGAIIQVPLFVEPGQRIKVDTRSGDYLARV